MEAADSEEKCDREGKHKCAEGEEEEEGVGFEKAGDGPNRSAAAAAVVVVCFWEEKDGLSFFLCIHKRTRSNVRLKKRKRERARDGKRVRRGKETRSRSKCFFFLSLSSLSSLSPPSVPSLFFERGESASSFHASHVGVSPSTHDVLRVRASSLVVSAVAGGEQRKKKAKSGDDAASMYDDDDAFLFLFSSTAAAAATFSLSLSESL